MCSRLGKGSTLCCTPYCGTACTTKLYDYTLASAPANLFGSESVAVSTQPVSFALASDQVATICPPRGMPCADLAFYGSLRLVVTGTTTRAPVNVALQIKVDDASLLSNPGSIVQATLVPGTWTAIAVRAVGKDVSGTGRDALFAPGAHTYSVVVSAATVPYVEDPDATLVIQYKGAFSLTTTK